MLFDTQLGPNDGAAFQLPNKGNVTAEKDFPGSEVPLWISTNSLKHPTVVGKGIILSLGAVVPDRVVLAKWGNIYYTDWDYSITPDASLTDDSAVALWWEAQQVAPGEERKNKTFYGVGKLTATSGQLSTTVYAPNVLTFDPEKEEPIFTVTAYIANNTANSAADVKATIQLPDGLVLYQDVTEKAISSINSNQVVETTWRVLATGTSTGVLTYSVAATASDIQGNTATSKISVPDWIGKDNSDGYVVWETNIPVMSSAQTVDQEMIIPSSITGKLYLQGTLYGPSGQTLAQDYKPFYIVQGNIALLLATDKKIYKPGETVTITGEARNLATVAESSLELMIDRQSADGSSQMLLSEALSLDGSGAHAFTATTTADVTGVFTINGIVTKNGSSVAEIAEQYETATPEVTASVSAPETVGNDMFIISVEITNAGKTNGTVNLSSALDNQIRQVDLLAGETKLVEYTAQITRDASYDFVFTGDLNQMITKAVGYGISGSISVESQTYSEGEVAVPVTVVNTGAFDAELDVTYTLQPSGDSVTKTYYLLHGTSTSDTLYYILTEGVYNLSAVISQPTTTATAALTVKKESRVDMTVAVGSQNGSVIPVTASLTNLGYSTVAGTIRITVHDSQGTEVWNSEQPVTLPATDAATESVDFMIDADILSAGNYTATVEILNGGGQQLATCAGAFTIQGPVIRVSQLPDYQSFASGQEATFVFKIKNTGWQTGSADIHFTADDLTDATQTVWLAPQEEKEITFSMQLPNDLEEKDYFAEYELISQNATEKEQIPYHVEGINLSVSASLDKSFYSSGETARFTLDVTNARTGDISLIARANYNGFEEQRPFTLTDKATLSFDIPLNQITGEQLFYGIYHAGGRSIHLNSAAVNEAGTLLITTDKTIYSPGEIVKVTVTSADPLAKGMMVLSGPEGYTENLSFNGSAERNIVLPAVMIAGIYDISCELETGNGETLTSTRTLEVKGIQVKISEALLDRGVYSPSDTVKAVITIASNTDLSGTLKTRIVDPEGTYKSAGEQQIDLLSSKPVVVAHESQVDTALSGIHRLEYGVYADELLLASGSEAFDVGNAMLLGLTTDKNDYTANTEPVIISASVYGTVDAVLELQLDGTTIQAVPLSLNGLMTISNELEIAAGPGEHVLKAVLTAGGLSSTKETSFVYGSMLPDLEVSSFQVQGSVRGGGTIEIAASITNQGKSASTSTTLAFYDGSSLLGTNEVKALGIGESDFITLDWNVLDKAGEHILTATIDPQDYVAEFNEKNNEAVTSIEIPDAAVTTETDKETYKIRQNVTMTAAITNLSASTSHQNVTLKTAVKDPSGNDVYAKSVAIGSLQPSATITVVDAWNTAGLVTDGVYSIVQTVFSGTEQIAQSTKPITLTKGADFSLGTDSATSRVRQGEQAAFTVDLEALYGWNNEVSLAADGLPAGTSIVFTPDKSVPPFQSSVAVTTTSTTPPGVHTFYLTAQGTDEGEIVARTVQVTLDVSGFSIDTAGTNQTVKQLDPAVFSLELTALNGYSGGVSLSVSGLPAGMRAFFDNSEIQAQGTANLTVLTSKYAKPGVYAITVEGYDGLVKRGLNLNITLVANPDIAYGIIATEGPGPRNEALVRIFDGKGQLLRELSAFTTRYGATAVAADLDGDGYDELIVAQGGGSKNTAVLRVFKKDGTISAEYQAGNAAGLTLASADLDGDWKDELIVGLGPDPKNQGIVNILTYSSDGFTEVATKAIYPEAKDGINVAAGDVDGDGTPEIITAPGPYSPATITVWRYDGKTLAESLSFTASDGSYGLNIAAGDVDGDGRSEIAVATGADPNAASIVGVYRGDGSLIGEFAPYDQKYTYGAFIAVGDLDDNGVAEIITGLGPGPHNEPLVKIFTADGTETGQFEAFPGDPGYGVKVSVGRIPR